MNLNVVYKLLTVIKGAKVKMMFLWVVICACVLVVYQPSEIAAKKLPSFVKVCSRNDQFLSTCWKKSLESLRPYLLKGIPELKIARIEPLLVPKLFMFRNDGRASAFNATFSDIKFTGLSEYEVVDNNIDLDTLNFSLKLRTPRILLNAFLDLHGVVLAFNMDGFTPIIMDWKNPIIDVKSKGEKYTEDGKTYIKWGDHDVSLTYDDIFMDLNNIFDDNPALTQRFNRVINENADLLYSHIRYVITHTIGTYITQSLTQVHQRFDIDTLYPKN